MIGNLNARKDLNFFVVVAAACFLKIFSGSHRVQRENVKREKRENLRQMIHMLTLVRRRRKS
jgi:hypothetical protein